VEGLREEVRVMVVAEAVSVWFNRTVTELAGML
jgi:hypothetical protein